ncbi:zinc finger protein 62 homolog isoform X1 [Neodiprion lecontei]|uniref:Zinc finger protein 62 homolog isoform X1 n=1 Tax=Neodiprion lecontei TaxID=441921 RepID=A0ABM3GAP7_NEOLC|nr:zinc finger protein 62 homolog isoform X1 [Neodiprion lecontei]
MSSLDYLDLCRLCLMKDRVSVPIFEGEGDVRQIFLKIAACLPVKVAREDKLPKKICDDCVYKVELLYQFWNTTANAEKQLLQWLGEVGLEDKQGYVTGVLNPSTMKQEENSSSGLGGTAIQVTGVQPGIGIGVIDNMGLGMPLIIPSSTQQQLTAVPMDTSTGPIQPIQPIQQAVPGPSSQPGHEQIAESQTNATTHQQDEEEETSDDEENSDDDCDGDDGLPVKEESEEDPSNSRTIEPTTFVNVSLACDEAGPSGLQQQKIVEMPEMAMPQTTDGDPKSGVNSWRVKFRRKLPEQEYPLKFGVNFKTACALRIANGLSKTLGKKVIISKSLLSRLQTRHPNTGNTQLAKEDSQSNNTFEHKSHTDKEHNSPEIGKASSSEHARVSSQKVNTDGSHLAKENDAGKNIIQQKLNTDSESSAPESIEARPNKRSCTPPQESNSDDDCFAKKDCKGKKTGEQKLDTETKTSGSLCLTASLRKHSRTTPQKSNLGGRRLTKEESKCQKASNQKLDMDSKSADSPFIAGSKSLLLRALQKTSNAEDKDLDKEDSEWENFISQHRFKPAGTLPDPDSIMDSQSELKCIICDREFRCKMELSRHIKSHNTRRPFKCAHCPKTFRTAYDQRKHAGCHDENLSYTCDICKVKFKSKQALKHHRIRKHDDTEYQFTCDKCSKQFKIKSDLSTHLKSLHTEAPSLVCEICGKSCKNGTAMSSHRRKHRTDFKKFECNICKRIYKSEHNLSNHLLVHEKGITCNECGMEFNCTKRLNYHMFNKHRQSAPCICSICHKPFKSNGSLRTHILTHTGERPYKCDLCGEAFTQRSSMMRHRRSHPGRFSPPPPIHITAIVKDIEEKEISKN